MGALYWNPVLYCFDRCCVLSSCCLASGAEDGTLRLWDTRVGNGGGVRELRCFGGVGDDIAVTSVAYSPDVRNTDLRLSRQGRFHGCVCVSALVHRSPL